jgi:hypothetical protein
VTKRKASGGFLDFAVSNAGSANANAFGSAVHDGAHALQIDVPTPLAYVVGVADPVPEHGPAPAEITYFGHNRITPQGKLQFINSALRSQPIWYSC